MDRGLERFSKCLKVSIDDMRKRCEVDMIVCGSEKTADLVRRSLDLINYDAHVIIDEEYPENRWSLTSYKLLGMIPGSGIN